MKQKVVSLTISAVSMGWGKLKDAGRGIKNLVVGAGKEVLEQAGTRVVTNGRAIGQTLVQSGKNLKSLVFKQIGVSVGEAATREVLNKAADTLSHFALEQFKPQISESIQCKVNAKFCGSSLMSLMRKMHILDMINHSHNLKRRIDKIVAEVISPEHNFWRKQWDSVGGPLCKGILSDSKYLGSPFSMGIRILGTLNGLQQITFIIDNFYNQLVKKLSSIDQETSFMAQLLHLHCDIDLSDAKGIVSMLQAQGVIDENEDLVFTDHKIEINCGDKYSHYKLQIVEFLNWLGEEISNGSVDDFSMIIKSVSDVITDQIIRVTESQLISPWSSYGIGEFTSVISARIQDKMIKSQILEEINSIDKKLKALEQKENLTAGDVNKIRELKAERSEKCKLISSPQTYSSVINHEAKQYTIAYSQCENIHYVQQKQKGNNTCKVISQEIMERIENTKSNKPADVADLIVLADENGLRVKIVDDPNYQPTEEEKSSDTKIIVFRKGEKDSENTDQIGHYQLKDSDGSLIDIQSNGNDCGYAVIAHLTGKPIQQLREEVVHFIKNNIFNFEKIVEAQQWIQTHYPQEANSLLLVGGEGVENDECDDQKGLFFLAQNAYQNKNPAVVSSKETTAPTEVSEKGIKLIKRYEGLKLRAYRCQAKVLTIGYGHTKGVKPGQQITSEKAEKLLLQDIKKHTNKIVISLKQAGASVNQNQLDALVSLSFNIGICAFLSSTLFRRIREKDYARAALEFGKWNKITSNGKKVESNGLTRRRAAEKKLFETPPRSAQISPNPVTLQPNRYSRLRCC